MENLTELESIMSIVFLIVLLVLVGALQLYVKLRTAFNLNLTVVLLFMVLGLLFSMPYFYIISVVFAILLPACKKTND